MEKIKDPLKKLVQRREELRNALKEHFSMPISKRNYTQFVMVVDELDEVRKKINTLKTR